MSTKMRGRSALATLEQIEPVELIDPRQQQAEREVNSELDEETRSILAQILGNDLTEDRVSLIRSIQFEVRRDWTHARDAFLRIGRALNRLDEMLTTEQRRRLRDVIGKLFPFSDPVASKLRSIARAVDGGLISATDCPGSYNTAYLLSILSPDQISAARQEQLIRVDVPRSLVEEFRRRLQRAQKPEEPSLADLRREAQTLTARIALLREQITAAENRRSEITRILGIEAGVSQVRQTG